MTFDEAIAHLKREWEALPPGTAARLDMIYVSGAGTSGTVTHPPVATISTLEVGEQGRDHPNRIYLDTLSRHTLDAVHAAHRAYQAGWFDAGMVAKEP